MRSHSTVLAELDWQIFGDFALQDFFLHLDLILSDDAHLYFEGTAIAEDVKQFFSVQALKPDFRIKRATIFPKPLTYHLPFTREVVQRLCDLSKSHAQMELFEHFKAYAGGALLIAAFEFRGDEPILISSRIPESKVKSFSEAIGCKYRKVML